MKCQHCEKPATIHITELTGPEPQEHHLCAEHAQQYLAPPEETTQPSSPLAGALAQQLKLGQTAAELARLDQKSCPVCGITFYEFRQQGRLGCPHDYTCFEKELEPLLVNIHGDTTHKGKRPRHGAEGASRKTRLIGLRREMRQAVEQEDYERASALRDQIRTIEKEGAA
jgi:protein arginine kinase activator